PVIEAQKLLGVIVVLAHGVGLRRVLVENLEVKLLGPPVLVGRPTALDRHAAGHWALAVFAHQLTPSSPCVVCVKKLPQAAYDGSGPSRIASRSTAPARRAERPWSKLKRVKSPFLPRTQSRGRETPGELDRPSRRRSRGVRFPARPEGSPPAERPQSGRRRCSGCAGDRRC